MQTILVTIVLCFCVVDLSFQQPPGVPPKTHGQPQQHQQPHQPQQQQQQQQQHHEGGHGHGHGATPLEFASEVHNADHILEHLQKVVSTKPKEEMTPEELEFHYFKLHDYDNNNKLDGVEIGKALTHFHDEGDSNETKTEDGSSEKEQKVAVDDEQIAHAIEGTLKMYDKNDDGYIEYFEFKLTKSTISK